MTIWTSTRHFFVPLVSWDSTLPFILLRTFRVLCLTKMGTEILGFIPMLLHISRKELEVYSVYLSWRKLEMQRVWLIVRCFVYHLLHVWFFQHWSQKIKQARASFSQMVSYILLSSLPHSPMVLEKVLHNQLQVHISLIVPQKRLRVSSLLSFGLFIWVLKFLETWLQLMF